jgi:hypothetical protein
MSSYLTAQHEDAERFNGFSHAANWEVMGFRAEALPSGGVGLRNASGDWIMSLTEWMKHDKRVLHEYRTKEQSRRSRINDFPDLLKDYDGEGEDKCANWKPLRDQPDAAIVVGG